jgi:hypothetical protein
MVMKFLSLSIVTPLAVEEEAPGARRMALPFVSTLVETATLEASVCETSSELVEAAAALEVWPTEVPSPEETAVEERSTELELVFTIVQEARIRAALEKEKKTFPSDFFSIMVVPFLGFKASRW